MPMQMVSWPWPGVRWKVRSAISPQAAARCCRRSTEVPALIFSDSLARSSGVSSMYSLSAFTSICGLMPMLAPMSLSLNSVR
ncbi:hypothetical protein D9M70_482020 [compost metagenome]